MMGGGGGGGRKRDKPGVHSIGESIVWKNKRRGEKMPREGCCFAAISMEIEHFGRSLSN